MKRLYGFTAVELLIVIVILGVLVAIIIPKFGDSGAQAKKSAALATLQSLRTQLQIAKIQHNEVYPDLGRGGAQWDVLLFPTEPIPGPNGEYEFGNGSPNDVGPYLRRRPENPFELSDTVTGIGQAQPKEGFVYDQRTGLIKVIVDPELFDTLNLDDEDFEFY